MSSNAKYDLYISKFIQDIAAAQVSAFYIAISTTEALLDDAEWLTELAKFAGVE
ncbi:hypothetical protein MPDQ_002568 [Monascus purpureus]|uniref:Uncharacterized protein n=1 Tax=Monascus purpureus TaxID=5098 RepID=A0A507R3Y0_MONPU|nr:hypothetical protein MPDQ_002568 [Monascus purpureus]